MSYFDFFTKNISQSTEDTKSLTNPQDELFDSTSAAHRPTERNSRSNSPQEVRSAGIIKKSSGKNYGSGRPRNILPVQKYTETNKPTSTEPSKSCEIIKGTCTTMCPADEVLLREKAKMVHILEVIDGKRVLVKCYSRSAADSKVAIPQLLRPYEILQDTVRHLLFRVTPTRHTSANVVYDFVCDRLRAVRQDMTVQRLSPAECITLLEPMIRFHVYFGYILCEYPIQVYDPVLNKKLLLECLKWFLSCCDSIHQSPEDLNSEMSLLNINNKSDIDKSQRESLQKSEKTKCDRVLMESLYVLCNLDDVHPMYRYWSLSKNLKSDPSIMLAYKIAVANLRGNYVRVCKQLENLCPLTYCALCLYLPTLQRRALQVMSVAYSSKQLSVPLGAARRWLRLESDAGAARAGARYGLRAAGGALRLARGDFRPDVPTHPPTRLILLDQKLDLSSTHVFTYTTKDYTYGIC